MGHSVHPRLGQGGRSARGESVLWLVKTSYSAETLVFRPSAGPCERCSSCSSYPFCNGLIGRWLPHISLCRTGRRLDHDCIHPIAPGLQLLAGLTRRPGDRQAGNSDRLASQRLPPLLDLEVALAVQRTAVGLAGGSRSHSPHVPRESAVARPSHSW